MKSETCSREDTKLFGVLYEPKGNSQIRMTQHVCSYLAYILQLISLFLVLQFVQNITPKPPCMEKNMTLFEEIAARFTLRWESRAASSSITEQVILCPVSFHSESGIVPFVP